MHLRRRQLVLGGTLAAAFPRLARAEAVVRGAKTVLGRFTTTYPSDQAHKARAFNVELAAEAIDNHTILPGASFSFNDAVGERTAAFGYAKAVVLRDGMIAEGMGGGACQVASTLHAAALLAGFDIVARAPHSRPSAYIRMGLDATVAFPKIDLKLRSTATGPVVIHARAARGSLEVWLDTTAQYKLDGSIRSEILERTPFERVFERDRSLAGDRPRIAAFGIPGYRVQRTREMRAPDGPVRRDVRIDVYPPVNQVVRVPSSWSAPSTQASEGEDLPDAARGPSLAALPVVDASVVRPVLVQLRPSTLVVLENAGP